MLHVTLDTNILIDLEERRRGFKKIQEIRSLHNEGKIKICIPAIAASEKFIDNKRIPNYSLFEKYLRDLNIRNHEELMPLIMSDIGYLDHGLLADDESTTLDHSIHKILFPNIEPEYKDFCEKRGVKSDRIDSKWRNAKIDVQMLWCHIYHKKDIFITRDGNFKRKSKELNQKVAEVVIMTPMELLKMVERK